MNDPTAVARFDAEHQAYGSVIDGHGFDYRDSDTLVHMNFLLPFLVVGLGSMAGGMSRYGLSLATQNVSAFSLPYGTLLSNLIGCLVIGLIAGLGAKTELMSTEMRLLLATGFCGGFTTMSSFIYELGQFLQDKEYFFASTYFAATLAGAGIAFALGLLLAGLVLR